MRTVKSNLILKYRCIYWSTTEVDFSLSGIVLISGGYIIIIPVRNGNMT